MVGRTDKLHTSELNIIGGNTYLGQRGPMFKNRETGNNVIYYPKLTNPQVWLFWAPDKKANEACLA